jgi:diaminopimelate epimerase
MTDPTGLSVVKAHAYGNDFLLVPEAETAGRDIAALARAMCDRHRGVGADGLILYAPLADRVRMRLHNADGGPAEISGNGLRCLAAYALARDLAGTGPGAGGAEARVRVETAAGLKTLRLVERRGGRWTFRAAMGVPSAVRQLDLEAAGDRVSVSALSIGNPQCVVFGPLDEDRFRRLGPALERHPAFPDRTNVSFVDAQSPARLRMLIWERGVGPTEASGTGACGAAVAAVVVAGANRDVEVESPGGVQRVEWCDEGLYLTGWAELLVDGRWVAESA